MRRGVVAVLTLFLLCLYPVIAVGEEVGSNDLIEQAKAYDGQEIVYSGEVIGDILDAGDHVWLNVSDGSNAIGVWTDRNLAREVQVAGRYAQHGDTVQVTGTFLRACPDHGGDFDIHAKSVTLIQRGYPVSHDVTRWKVWLAVLLTMGAAGCMAFVLARLGWKMTARRNQQNT
jgi:hypothetical protein